MALPLFTIGAAAFVAMVDAGKDPNGPCVLFTERLLGPSSQLRSPKNRRRVWPACYAPRRIWSETR